ncbi:acid alpha-amylase [Nematostella vectensis]|uniref:acid alpha-amylase n=1 Tax=Nematostella vectensis TaxID=45351 RepID=UPI002076F911|nr:acid alpha-amylase [Nematostella vectensis]
MHTRALCCVLVVIFATYVAAKTAEEWKNRIIYQLLTDRFAQSGEMPAKKCTDMRGWCNGTFKGIEKHLDYITGLGANAIWISPIVLNTDRGFHGYWAKNIYEIEPHFGTKQDLKSLVKACHDRGVWVMVDVVANHMGYPPGVDWRTPWNSSLLDNFYEYFYPFNKSEYYHANHKYIKWPEECHNLTKIQKYWLANLADLDQSHPFVEKTLLDWIKWLITEYDFDGCRVDTVIQVPKPFWTKFQSAGGVFMLGEANNGPPPCGTINFTAPFQGPLDSVLDFPMFWTLRYIFQEKTQNFTSLSKALKESSKAFKDRSILGGFVDNHDHERFLHKNPSQTSLRNNLVFVLMSRWIPLIYYGTEQGFNGGGDPNNRESLWPFMDRKNSLYVFIKDLIAFRSSLGQPWISSPQIEQHVEPEVYAFSRRKVLVIVTTRVTTASTTLQSHPFNEGEKVVNILNMTQTFLVDAKGRLEAKMVSGEPLVLTLNVTSYSRFFCPSIILIVTCWMVLHMM